MEGIHAVEVRSASRTQDADRRVNPKLGAKPRDSMCVLLQSSDTQRVQDSKRRNVAQQQK